MNWAIVDPRGAANEVEQPAVVWEESNESGRDGAWQGRIGGDEGHPQAELRRELENGVDVVVYVGLGEIERKQGDAPAGVIIASNGAAQFGWKDWYTLAAAVGEAIERLMALQKEILGDVAAKLAGDGTEEVDVPE